MKDGCQVITLEGEAYANEFAILTPLLSGKEFAELKETLAKTNEILGSLRMVAE